MYDRDMRNRELNNGRFAMFATSGILAAELFTGQAMGGLGRQTTIFDMQKTGFFSGSRLFLFVEIIIPHLQVKAQMMYFKWTCPGKMLQVPVPADFWTNWSFWWMSNSLRSLARRLGNSFRLLHNSWDSEAQRRVVWAGVGWSNSFGFKLRRLDDLIFPADLPLSNRAKDKMTRFFELWRPTQFHWNSSLKWLWLGLKNDLSNSPNESPPKKVQWLREQFRFRNFVTAKSSTQLRFDSKKERGLSGRVLGKGCAERFGKEDWCYMMLYGYGSKLLTL